VEVLRRRKFEAYGIDLSKWCIKHSPVGKYLHFGSATSLPCKDQSVDVISCIDTFQYLNRDEAKKAVKELRRVTRKYLCFESITWEDEKFSDPKENPDTIRKHNSLFTQEELIELFKNAGFKLKKRRFLPRKIVGSMIKDREYYEYDFSFNAIFEAI
jgi:ubiquinone/menaquinone biosynthesis C-methylase UbiE